MALVHKRRALEEKMEGLCSFLQPLIHGGPSVHTATYWTAVKSQCKKSGGKVLYKDSIKHEFVIRNVYISVNL